ncbi:MlaD family protein [[Mycobacterium] wendilense]|uniref:MlaD family protein n=1 Tax=[Mycobacterium] wendilense TaxID=3064284 RepID=A0ABN9P4D1_9MYCO|nr:MlaD family protein [Mycolicibacterium sp. MU0050]CAJ1586826.1 MlaD family protein [Mycolicibacterium sp. MU0050]
MEVFARGVVDATRFLAARRSLVAFVGLLLVVALTAGYVVVGALRLNPARKQIAVEVLLSQSGGLLPNQDVTLRGVPVGRVQTVDFTKDAVRAVAVIDGDARIPVGTPVRVSALSPAGEQYLDFRPRTDSGPFLINGSIIDEQETAVPVPFADLLADAEGLLHQVDPEKVSAIMRELRVESTGPKKLAALLDGGTFLISTLDSVLPETISVIRNSRVVSTTIAAGRSALQSTTRNIDDILGGADRMDTGFRRLVDTGGAPLHQLDAVIADNSETMIQLLGNLVTIAQLSYVRVPALKALFPDTRGSMLEAVAGAIRDGGVWALVDPYPRYGCDYNLPRHPPSQADYPEPYLHTYCDNPDPSVLIRGARNAPRPPGDDTDGPPPGYDPSATTDPTPVGRYTIPLPYGGPPLPLEPPN